MQIGFFLLLVSSRVLLSVTENPEGFSDAENYDLSNHYVRVVDDRFAIYYKVLEVRLM